MLYVFTIRQLWENKIHMQENIFLNVYLREYFLNVLFNVTKNLIFTLLL